MGQRNIRIPRAGKTVLAGIIIEEAINAASPSTTVAYYYCGYRRGKSREIGRILASLAGQLARQNELCYKLIIRCYKPTQDGIQHHTLPDDQELSNLIIRMSSHFDDVAIVVDALDECQTPYNATEVLKALVDHARSNVRLAILSRDELDIKSQMHDFDQVSIAARSSDLKLYVNAQMEEKCRKGQLQISSPGLKEEIMDDVVNGADGM